MPWLRNWLAKRADHSAKASTPTNSFRPQVESLDDRIVPTVSTTITAAGTFTLAVSTDNVLIAIDAAGNQSKTGFTNVRTAQAFRDGVGGLGADIVFRDGSWLHFDNTLGGATMFTADMAKTQLGGLVLDAGTAYNDKGQIRLDILTSADNMVDTNGNTFADALGSLSEFTFATGLKDTGLGSNVRWVSTYNAADGGTGIALGQVTAAGQPGIFDDTLLVRKADSVTGVTTLYNGIQSSAAAIVEYSQTTSLPAPGGILAGPTTTPRTVVIDVVFEGQEGFDPMTGLPTSDNGYALQFTTGGTGGGFLGLGGAANVTSISSTDGSIETGIFYPGTKFHP